MKITHALATTAFGIAVMLPLTGHAATVGYRTDCYYAQGDTAAVIREAGHTPVPLASLDAASLAPLGALMYESCNGLYTSGVVVDQAVANGMVLVVHPWSYGQTVELPGRLRLTSVEDQTATLFPPGSPALAGPGGRLDSATPYISYPQGFWARTALPVGSQVVATSDANADYVAAFAYNHGRGRVVASTVALNYFLLNGSGQNDADAAEVRTYASNLVAWALTPRFTTCAAEGFAGPRLTMCRQICEVDQTPARLTNLIRLYLAIYRTETPCSR